MRKLTFEGLNRFPVWSPDGQRIGFQSDRQKDLGIFERRADGTGEVVRLTTPKAGERHVPESWSPDGKYLSFTVVNGSVYSLWVFSRDDGSVAPFNGVESTEPFGSAFSPDGRWLAYHALPQGVSPESTDSGVFIEPFPATGARYQAPKVNRDFHPAWSPDSTALMYLPSVASGQLAIARISTGSGVTFAAPELIPFSLAGGHLSGQWRAFDVLRDGRFVGLTSAQAVPPEGAEVTAPNFSIRYVINWFEELKRQVPTQ
jgi:Tol biopolymer transport system component